MSKEQRVKAPCKECVDRENCNISSACYKYKEYIRTVKKESKRKNTYEY